MGAVKFNSLGIELTQKELYALRRVVQWVHLMYSAKLFGLKIPDDWELKPVKKLIGQDNSNLIYVSEYSRRKKFNSMP